MPKKKTTMSAAARKRIGDAQKIRWAAYRRAKAAGRTPRPKAKRGRGRAAKGRNPYLEMSISRLVECRQQIDAALAEVRRHI